MFPHSTSSAVKLIFESGLFVCGRTVARIPDCKRIPFQLGEKDAANGMTCNGDTIVLPEGKKYNKTVFSGCRLRTGDFAPLSGAGGNKSEVIVPSYTGCWTGGDIRDIPKGYLKDAEVVICGGLTATLLQTMRGL